MNKKIKKSKKGFTLVEVLAVITVIVVIGLVSFPALSKTIKAQQDDAYNSKVNDIILAAKSYNGVNENVNSEISVSDLLSNGYLTGTMTDPRDSSEMNGCIYVDAGVYTYKEEECEGKINTLLKVVQTSYPNLLNCSTTEGAHTTTEYTYMGGCYLEANITNNYLNYSGSLWRIMGINSDNSIRIVKAESTDDEKMTNATSIYTGSTIKTWLESTYYATLSNKDILVNGSWCMNSIGDEDTSFNEETSYSGCSSSDILTAKIATLSLTEYSLSNGLLFATGLESYNSYLVNSDYYWTLNSGMNEDEGPYLWVVRDDGSLNYFQSGTGTFYVRPVVNIDGATIVKGGTGIANNPYTLKI